MSARAKVNRISLVGILAPSLRIIQRVFFAASLAWNFGLGMTWLAIPLYAYDQGLSNAQIGALFAAPVLAQAPLNLAGGAYTDRIGGRRIMLGSCWATVAAGSWVLVCARFLV